MSGIVFQSFLGMPSISSESYRFKEAELEALINQTELANRNILLKLSYITPYTAEEGLDGPHALFNIIDRFPKSKEHLNYGTISITLSPVAETPSLFYDGHIGFFIQEEHRGNGYALAAIQALILFAKKRLALSPIYACCEAENQPCFSTLVKSGGEHQGLLDVPKGLNLWKDDGIAQVHVFRFE